MDADSAESLQALLAAVARGPVTPFYTKPIDFEAVLPLVRARAAAGSVAAARFCEGMDVRRFNPVGSFGGVR